MKQLTKEDQLTLLKIKSLLNHLSYIIKKDDAWVVSEFHALCRKYCSWGNKDE